MISYAQNFEDVMLWRALGHITGGFYIDIGAQDPIVDSVSLAFYEQGWRGVHVEPTPAYAQALREARPDETVLQTAVGAERGLIGFHEIPHTGISTGDAAIAARHQAAGFKPRRIDVPCIRLCDLLDGQAGREVHWMKIDVEGMERSVLESWAPSAVRPWVLVVEATVPFSRQLSHADWEPLVTQLGYRFCHFDGLNRFYVAEAHDALMAAFTLPPNLFDGFVLAGTASHSLCRRLNASIDALRGEAVELQARANDLDARLQAPPRDEAALAQLAELQQHVAEQAAQSAQRLREATAQARQVALTLAHLEGAKEETLQLLKALAARDKALAAQSVQTDAARADVARLQREIDAVRTTCDARLAEQQAALDIRLQAAEALRARVEQDCEAQTTLLHQRLDDLQRRAAEREQALHAEHAAGVDDLRRRLQAECDERLQAQCSASDAALDAARVQIVAMQAEHNRASEALQAAEDLAMTLRQQTAAQVATAAAELQALRRSAAGRLLGILGWQPPQLAQLPVPGASEGAPAATGSATAETDAPTRRS